MGRKACICDGIPELNCEVAGDDCAMRDELDYGEGKTRKQDADDSALMVGMIMLVAVAFIVALAIVIAVS